MITSRYIRCLAITHLNDNFQIYKMLGNNMPENLCHRCKKKKVNARWILRSKVIFLNVCCMTSVVCEPVICEPVVCTLLNNVSTAWAVLPMADSDLVSQN